MKSIKLKSILLSFFIIFLFNACGKNEDSYTGTLNVSFTTHPEYLAVQIYAIEDKKNPIYEKSPSAVGHKLTVQLNPGNYILVPYAIYPNAYNNISFQISPNKTVNIHYNAENVGSIKYE